MERLLFDDGISYLMTLIGTLEEVENYPVMDIEGVVLHKDAHTIRAMLNKETARKVMDIFKAEGVLADDFVWPWE